MSPRFISVNGNSLIGFEVLISFDGKAEFAADSREFDEAHIAELGLAHS